MVNVIPVFFPVNLLVTILTPIYNINSSMKPFKTTPLESMIILALTSQMKDI